jgi:hypothetical protein
VREDDRVGEPLLELDRDRRTRPPPAFHERLGFLANQLTQLFRLELRLPVGRGEQATDRARDRTDARAAGRQLPAGLEQPFEQFLAARGLLLGDFDQRLDRPTSHPAPAVGPISAQLLNPLPQDRGHGGILSEGRHPPRS